LRYEWKDGRPPSAETADGRPQTAADASGEDDGKWCGSTSAAVCRLRSAN